MSEVVKFSVQSFPFWREVINIRIRRDGSLVADNKPPLPGDYDYCGAGWDSIESVEFKCPHCGGCLE